MRFFQTAVVLLAVTVTSACTVTDHNGQTRETSLGRWYHNLPQGYSGQQPVVLKPPAHYGVVALPAYQPVPPVPGTSVSLPPPMVAPVVSAPMPPPVMPGSAASVTTTTTMTTQQWQAPLTPPGDMMSPVVVPTPVYDVAPPAPVTLTAPLVTREVDYGDSITIYPLDARDAAMPYIPPATTSSSRSPLVSTSTTRVRADQHKVVYNQ